MRLLFTVQYLGTRYSGWQIQANAPSVQQVLEDAFSKLYGASVAVAGAGRTDAGVHAEAQRAHIDAPFAVPSRGLLFGINNLLPPDIRVTAVEEVEPTLHSRFQAKTKTYVYRIWNGEVEDVFAHETHAHVGQPLDAAAMDAGVQHLLGEHDFRAFTVAEPEVSSTVRTVTHASVTRHGARIEITLSADGFLRYMVRRVAGMLIEVGRRKLEPDAVRRSLEPAFEPSRWTAPAKGLTLLRIDY